MSIYTNWDPLEVVIVGSLGNHPIDPSVTQIFEETKEDLENLCDFLKKFGVVVLRPDNDLFSKYRIFKNKFGTIQFPTFKIDMPLDPLLPRDQYFVYGKTILQTYTSLPDRYLDSLSFYDVFRELFESGYNWISQPPPNLIDVKGNQSWFNEGRDNYKNFYQDKLLWHTATMFKCGDALITNTAGPGTELGLKWIERNLDTRIVGADGTNSNGFGHIDHGWFMTDDETVFALHPGWLPEVLKNKKTIYVEDLVEMLDYKVFDQIKTSANRYDQNWVDQWLSEWKGYVQEVAFDTNVLVLDPNNVIFINEQPRLFALMEKMGINCHVVPMRHSLFWEGGIHCFTLDVARKGDKRKII
jgi:glycine amidinotransferase